jgi:tetratricopeptide (TPR) repeat protein
MHTFSRTVAIVAVLFLLPDVGSGHLALAREAGSELSARAKRSCPNIVGVWNSWASGLFGRSDTIFRSNGTAIHRSGIPGKWWCEGGTLRMSWGGEPAKSFRLSDDGRQLIGPGDTIGFSRETAAPTRREQQEARKQSEGKAAPAIKPAAGKPAVVAEKGTKSASGGAREAAPSGPKVTLAELNAAIAHDPRNAKAYRDRGNYYLDQGDTERALADFSRAEDIESPPRQPATQAAGMQTALLDQAIAREPKNPKVYYERANAFAGAGDYDRALADYNQAIVIDPKFVDAYYNRGVVYQMRSEFERAISDYDLAITFNPNFAAAYNNRGVALKAKGDAGRAIADFERAAELDAPNTFTYFDRIVALDPRNAKAYLGRGKALLKAGDANRALADLDKAIELDPAAAAGYSDRADIYVSKGDFVRAIADLDKAVALGRIDANTYLRRGSAHQRKGDKSIAIADFRKVLELEPGNVVAKLNLMHLGAGAGAKP